MRGERRRTRWADAALALALWLLVAPMHGAGAQAIAEQLAAHGRAGVPLYLVYGPAQPDVPEVLPELLTPERVVTALERAALTAGPVGLSTPTHVTR